MCVSGPNLRATGVPFDVRRAHPYSIYPELDFDIPTRSEGDSLARYLLRVDEVKQSLRIIDQCLHQMPDGPVMAKLPRLIRPRPGRAYAAVESPRGQYSNYVISDGTDQPFRLRIHDPSFLHLRRSAGSCRATSSPTRWRSWRASIRSWAASTSDAPSSARRLAFGSARRSGTGRSLHRSIPPGSARLTGDSGRLVHGRSLRRAGRSLAILRCCDHRPVVRVRRRLDLRRPPSCVLLAARDPDRLPRSSSWR